uniref:BPTI/Kunitz inhibitor domain-containing protein n=1 Tax=Chelonoidis abingdonii TaxID=106734 RepID=A0A8C0GBN3_CHEAB
MEVPDLSLIFTKNIPDKMGRGWAAVGWLGALGPSPPVGPQSSRMPLPHPPPWWPGSFKEICKLPVDAGSCFSYMTRYFYNSVTDSCEEFVYGGCEGNGNRFATKNECLKTCGSPGKRARRVRETQTLQFNDVCKLPVDSGSCFSYVTRYFYNFVTKKCEAFTYGGCEGNGNRFASIDECLRTCGSAGKRVRAHSTCQASCGPETSPLPLQSGLTSLSSLADLRPFPGDICRLPPETGPCEALIPRFFYNPASRTCKSFIYSGCQGNGNNFRTLLECQRACWKRGKGTKLKKNIQRVNLCHKYS